ncbi:MAG TPA: CRISPR system precrRNA processing endoribonuclease RAMP protein Cas6, partial [Nevskiaceae bacterium]
MIGILPLRLGFHADEALHLPPYPGSLWRSAFGAALHRRSCITGAESCHGCPIKQHCAYGFLFETPQPTAANGLVQHYHELPRPYVLSPCHAGGRHAAGTPLELELTLIHPAERFLPEVVAAMKELRLGPTSLHLDTVHLRGPEPAALDPYDAHALSTLQPFTPIVPAPPASATLRFDHPLRLRRDNHYLRPDEFDFATFFTTLVRRASMLAALSGTALPDDDYAALAEAARGIRIEDTDLRWWDWSRRSARQQRRIPMGGIVGAIIVSGSLERLWPWLWV